MKKVIEEVSLALLLEGIDTFRKGRKKTKEEKLAASYQVSIIYDSKYNAYY